MHDFYLEFHSIVLMYVAYKLYTHISPSVQDIRFHRRKWMLTEITSKITETEMKQEKHKYVHIII